MIATLPRIHLFTLLGSLGRKKEAALSEVVRPTLHLGKERK